MPVLYVAAGPSGCGKTSAFSVADRNLDYFIGDDIAAVLNNKAGLQVTPGFFVEHRYHELPLEIIQAADYTDISDTVGWEIKKIGDAFIEKHLNERKSFAIESTLTNDAMLKLAKQAAKQGFTTIMDYVAVDTNEISMERIQNRTDMGKIYFTENECRLIREMSFAHLPEAMEIFAWVKLYDNSVSAGEPLLVMTTEHGQEIYRTSEMPRWLKFALYDSKFDLNRQNNPKSSF